MDLLRSQIFFESWWNSPLMTPMKSSGLKSVPRIENFNPCVLYTSHRACTLYSMVYNVQQPCVHTTEIMHMPKVNGKSSGKVTWQICLLYKMLRFCLGIWTVKAKTSLFLPHTHNFQV